MLDNHGEVYEVYIFPHPRGKSLAISCIWVKFIIYSMLPDIDHKTDHIVIVAR